jgi:glucokinase
MRYAIGIDIGVTNIKSVCVTPAGEVLAEDRILTRADDPGWPARVREHVAALEARRGEPAAWLGIAAPGIARPDGRAIWWMQGRLDEVEGLVWAEYLERPAPLLNDAQAALLGEVWKGAARGARHAVLLTLGTGVGGAALCDGRLLKGSIGRAGHFGHTCVDFGGIPDMTGLPGTIEDAIGNYTIERRTRGRFKTTHDLVAAHAAGDPEAGEVWLRSVRALAAGVASAINVIDPEKVIIGGGIAVAGPALFAPLAKCLDEMEWRAHGHRVPIVPAALGDLAGAFGAAWNAMQEAGPAGGEARA